MNYQLKKYIDRECARNEYWQRVKLLQGDCLEVMKGFADNTFDSVVCDPPYGISFMAKKWDYDVPKVEVWQECLRVLKPGGYVLIACGTRTQHRMAVNIEDAGFEIRDLIFWHFGSGFPKSLNVRLNIEKGIDNIIKLWCNSDIWKNNLKNASDAENRLLKNPIEIGMNTQKNGSVQGNVPQKANQEKSDVFVYVVDENFIEANHILRKEHFAPENVGQNIQTPILNAKHAENELLKRIVVSRNPNIFFAVVNVKELLNESITVKIKDEEARRIWLGKWLSSKEMDINANFVGLIGNLKRTILRELRNTQNYDTIFQTELLIATNVIITKSIMERLISNTASILKEITKNITNGIGTALKPACEIFTLARKPLSEPTVAANVLKWGTGGLNIDGCRVGTDRKNEREYDKEPMSGKTESNTSIWESGGKHIRADGFLTKGRWPANVMHDGSQMVLDLFPQSKSTSISKQRKAGNEFGQGSGWNQHENKDSGLMPAYGDSGSAARFFKCFPLENTCLFCLTTTQKHNTMKETIGEVLCKKLNVQPAEKSLRITPETIASTVPQSAMPKASVKLVQYVKSAESLCDLCATAIAQSIVAMQHGQSPDSLLGKDFINEHKKQILIQNLALLVASLENIDTIPTIASLKLLFGSVRHAIDTSTEESIMASSPSRFRYQSKASKAERNAGCERHFALNDNVPEKDIKEIKHLLSI